MHRNLRTSSLALLLAFAPFAAAQTPAVQTTPAAPSVTEPTLEQAHLDLPDSPGTTVRPSGISSSNDASADPEVLNPDEDSSDQAATSAPAKHAPHLQYVIRPNETADPLTVHEKIVGGFKDSISLFSAAGWLGAAGWEQLWNDSPNYGTDAGAFGQRLGAAAIRGISEGVFSESLFAPLFREDPRYYVMGGGHNIFKRAIYAGTRTIITRTDGGHNTPNLSLIAGNGAGSALTILYYPSKNTSTKEVLMTWGGGLGGSAVGFLVNEFLVDALEGLHLKSKQP
jgi:hypothetical protein